MESPEPITPASRLARLLSDPVRLRRASRIGLLLTASLASLAWALEPGPLRSLLVAVGWIFVPIVAAGLGLGDAFFIEHGRGTRRAILAIVAGTVVMLAGCGLLASIDTTDATTARRALAGIVYGLFYGAVILVLGAFIALLIGRGSGYVSRKIQEVDDDGW
jgi:hypothetical protein